MAPRPARRIPALLLAVLLPLAGCGGDDVTATPGEPVTPEESPVVTGEPTAGEPTADPTGDAAGPPELVVTVVADAGAAPTTWTLTCPPGGGNHPDPGAACAALAATADPFAEPPSDQTCTQVYGGPQTASVTGTFDGKRVSASFARTNGCEIARWESLEPLLGPGGGPAS